MSKAVEKKKLKSERRRRRLLLWSVVRSVLSGNFSTLDLNHEDFLERVSKHRFTGRINFFQYPFFQKLTDKNGVVRRIKKFGLWVKSPYGVYTIAKNEIPLEDEEGLIYTESGHNGVFSAFPDFTADTLMRRDPNINPSDEEIETRVSVLGTYLDNDLSGDTGKNDIGHPFRKIFEAHNTKHEERLRKHASLWKDSENDNIYRNGSSCIWFHPDRKRPGYYNAYYMYHPYGNEGIYINQIALDNSSSYTLIRCQSIHMNDEPIHEDDRHEFVRNQWPKIASRVMRYRNPFDLFEPSKKLAKYRYKIVNGINGSILFISHLLFNLSKQHALVSAGISGISTGIISFIIGGFALGAAFAGEVNRAASNATNSAVKTLTRTISKPKFNFITRLNDHSQTMASNDLPTSLPDDATALPVNAKGFRNMVPVTYQAVRNSFTGASEYDDGNRRRWAIRVILDSVGTQEGNIFSEKTMPGGQKILCAELANGIEKYVLGENYVGIKVARDPLAGYWIADAIKDLLVEYSADKGQILTIHCPDPEKQEYDIKVFDCIKDAYKNRPKQRRRNTTKPEKIMTKGLAVLPEKTRKKYAKRGAKKLRNILEEAMHRNEDQIDRCIDSYTNKMRRGNTAKTYPKAQSVSAKAALDANVYLPTTHSRLVQPTSPTPHTTPMVMAPQPRASPP